ncbi:UNVERIFIED_CONTAM: Leucine-rich repeat receptor-like serine/threonine/tyrosine-protein kinase SOBIR1 [Sesamum radiatum]|uniref:Leucine-rich repeat receptor-like serine/threonine/tyrosine-protein kinase SOBIR1 n=1 Tax=Sesamum radiatum TaxID=300843 RepID=A0AAW2PJ94_SESRA
MALTPCKSHFFLCCFLTLIFLVQSRPSLLSSDFDALLLVHKGFGLGLRRAPERNPCDSVGVFCERRVVNGSYVLRVTRLVFESQQLKGRLSPAIGQLSELKELSLPNNLLVDQIPAQIVDCQKLEVLNLGNNRFSGKIPSGLSSLIRLRVLDLSANRFTGILSS